MESECAIDWLSRGPFPPCLCALEGNSEKSENSSFGPGLPGCYNVYLSRLDRVEHIIFNNLLICNFKHLGIGYGFSFVLFPLVS